MSRHCWKYDLLTFTIETALRDVEWSIDLGSVGCKSRHGQSRFRGSRYVAPQMKGVVMCVYDTPSFHMCATLFFCSAHVSGLQRAVVGGRIRESHSDAPALLARTRGFREVRDNAGDDAEHVTGKLQLAQIGF